MASTAIRSFSYDDESATLFVTFTDGDVYAYRGVQREVHDGFQSAFSKGRYFSAKVRGRYPYIKLPEAARDAGQGTDRRGGHSPSIGHTLRDPSRHERIRP
jgi:lysyl-tRNA synthetase class 2